MQNDSQDKMMKGTESRNKARATEQEYFFSGGLEYDPITIKASSYEEAFAEWELRRKKSNN